MTVLWIVGIVNAVNLIDGLDGLAVGIALLVLVTTLVGGWYTQNFLVIQVVGVLIGALLGFLPHNHHRASIFLGDSGSLMLGFLLAYLSLQGAQQTDGSFITAGTAMLSYTKDGQTATVTITGADGAVSVIIMSE